MAKKEEITKPSLVEPKKTIKKNAAPKLKKTNTTNQRKETTPTKKAKENKEQRWNENRLVGFVVTYFLERCYRKSNWIDNYDFFYVLFANEFCTRSICKRLIFLMLLNL